MFEDEVDGPQSKYKVKHSVRDLSIHVCLFVNGVNDVIVVKPNNES